MLILASRINPPKVNEKKKFVSFCFRIFDSISRNMALYNSSNGEIHYSLPMKIRLKEIVSILMVKRVV